MHETHMKHIWVWMVEKSARIQWQLTPLKKYLTSTNIVLPFWNYTIKQRCWIHKLRRGWCPHRDVYLPLHQTVAKKSDARVHCAEQKIGHALGPEPFWAGSKGGWGRPCGLPLWVTSERWCFAPFTPLGAWHPCAGLIFTGYWYETYFFWPKTRLYAE